MRDYRINYAVVGSFVIAMIALALATILYLQGRSGATDEYFSVFKNVFGIKAGTRVHYEGYPFGQVQGISPFERGGAQRFRLELEIEQGWKIPQDSRISITAGLLSAATLEIEQGSSSVMLQPGSEIPAAESPDIFSALSGVAGQVSGIMDDQIGPLLDDLGDKMPTIAANLEEFSAKLNTTGDRLNELLDEENIAALDAVLTNAEVASGNLAELSGELRSTKEQIDELLAQLDGVVTESRPEISASLEELRYSLSAVSRNIDGITRNLQGGARNMNEFTRQIRANPGVLLGGRAQPDEGGR